MCTLNEYDTFEIEEASLNTIAPSTTDTMPVSNDKLVCKKCGCQEIQVFLRNKNGYCKTCFLSILMHKFKATLGKSRLMRPNDSILVAYSGKANSTVLLHLITAYANELTFKKLQFQFKVLYIDDGTAKGRTFEEKEQIRDALIKEAESTSLRMYTVSLSQCLIDTTDKKIRLINDQEAQFTKETDEDSALQKMFADLESDTARDELLKQLRQKLIVSAARELGCNKIFIADTEIDLAIKVLGDVSIGRGSQLSFNVAFSDTRYNDVMLLRPLKDFTKEHIINYLDCYELYPIFDLKKCCSPFPASIRNVTTNFIDKLDSEFYTTVSTIYRTSEKLSAKIVKYNDTNINSGTNINVNNICIICELPLDSFYLSGEQLSVIQAKVFSKLVSTDTSLDTTINSLNIREESSNTEIESTSDITRKMCACNSGNSCNPNPKEPMIETYLCYSCKLIFLNSKQIDNSLPNFILNALKKKLQLEYLKKEIADFLL